VKPAKYENLRGDEGASEGAMKACSATRPRRWWRRLPGESCTVGVDAEAGIALDDTFVKVVSVRQRVGYSCKCWMARVVAK